MDNGCFYDKKVHSSSFRDSIRKHTRSNVMFWVRTFKKTCSCDGCSDFIQRDCRALSGIISSQRLGRKVCHIPTFKTSSHLSRRPPTKNMQCGANLINPNLPTEHPTEGAAYPIEIASIKPIGRAWDLAMSPICASPLDTPPPPRSRITNLLVILAADRKDPDAVARSEPCKSLCRV